MVAHYATGIFAEFALLHSSLSSFASDVDAIAKVGSRQELDEFRLRLEKEGIVLVGVWEYDINSITLLFANQNSTAALDLLCDESACNKYGIAAGAQFMFQIVQGLPYVSDIDYLLYRAVKGSIKRDTLRVVESVERLRRADPRTVTDRATSLFTPFTRDWLLDCLGGSRLDDLASKVSTRMHLRRRLRQGREFVGAISDSVHSPQLWCVLREDPNFLDAGPGRFAMRFAQPWVILNKANPRLTVPNYFWESLAVRLKVSNTISSM